MKSELIAYPESPSKSQSLPEITSAEVHAAVLSFPAGSSGGMFGLKPLHLKDVLGQLKHEHENDLCRSLASLKNLMVDGKVPEEVLPALYEATLTEIEKNRGIRPIACGNVFRRLVAKVVCCRLKVEVASKLRPSQLGFAVKGGAEAIVHTVREFVSRAETCKVIVKLDFVNAFNTFRRDMLVECVNWEVPTY